MNRAVLPAAMLLFTLATSASAIMRRHDVPDSRYLALAAGYRMTVADIAVPSEDGRPLRGNGIGTLVAPDWILTAAHTASRVMPGHERSRVTGPHTVYVEGRPYVIDRVVLHPRYSAEERPWIDIALIKLRTPVRGARPACLYAGTDEVGQVATLGGNGSTGTGLTGPAGVDDHRLRASTVRIQDTQAEDTVLWCRSARPTTRG